MDGLGRALSPIQIACWTESSHATFWKAVLLVLNV